MNVVHNKMKNLEQRAKSSISDVGWWNQLERDKTSNKLTQNAKKKVGYCVCNIISGCAYLNAITQSAFTCSKLTIGFFIVIVSLL